MLAYSELVSESHSGQWSGANVFQDRTHADQGANFHRKADRQTRAVLRNFGRLIDIANAEHDKSGHDLFCLGVGTIHDAVTASPRDDATGQSQRLALRDFVLRGESLVPIIPPLRQFRLLCRREMLMGFDAPIPEQKHERGQV